MVESLKAMVLFVAVALKAQIGQLAHGAGGAVMSATAPSASAGW